MTKKENKYADRANTTEASSGVGRSRSVNRQWLNPYLDAQDKEWLNNERSNQASVILELLDVLEAGYSLNVKVDSQSGRWNAILFCDVPDCPNSGYALSVRGSTAANSAYCLAYLHIFKYGTVWPTAGVNDLGEFG